MVPYALRVGATPPLTTRRLDLMLKNHPELTTQLTGRSRTAEQKQNHTDHGYVEINVWNAD